MGKAFFGKNFNFQEEEKRHVSAVDEVEVYIYVL